MHHTGLFQRRQFSVKGGDPPREILNEYVGMRPGLGIAERKNPASS